MPLRKGATESWQFLTCAKAESCLAERSFRRDGGGMDAVERERERALGPSGLAEGTGYHQPLSI